MNNVSYTVLKLTNGEDIICEVDYEQYDLTAKLPQRVFEIQNPLLMLSTNSMPSITLPNTVYCLSKNGAGLKQIKN